MKLHTHNTARRAGRAASVHRVLASVLSAIAMAPASPATADLDSHVATPAVRAVEQGPLLPRQDTQILTAPRPAPGARRLPAFRSSGRIDVPSDTCRLAVDDVADDSRARLLLLGSDNVLTICSVTQTGIKPEAHLDLGAHGAEFAAGHFAKGRPALIATPGELYYRDGGDYHKKPLPDVAQIMGTVRFTDGSECFFSFPAGGTEPIGHRIDLTRENLLSPARNMVPLEQGAGVYSRMVLRAPQELLAELEIPEQGRRAGVVGVFDPRGNGSLYLWVPWVDQDGSTLHIIDMKDEGELPPVWSSPKLAGRVLDVAYGADPREPGQQGFAVLEAIGEAGKGRLVEFFTLD